jgi:hypothetical protein
LSPDAADARLHETVNLLLKLFAFVAVPAVVLCARGFGWAQTWMR